MTVKRCSTRSLYGDKKSSGKIIATLKTALLWDITQRVVTIPFRRFGTTYLSHLQWPKILTLEDMTDRLARKVGKEIHYTLLSIAQEGS
jgi:hypothetical protein